MSTRQTLSWLMKLFNRHGINPRSDLGQNFLIDLNQIDFIVEQAQLTRDDVVLEVGPGTGSLTARLGELAGSVLAVDLDPMMARLATEATAHLPGVTVLNMDALKNKNNFSPLLLQELRARLAEGENRRLKLIANLPYNIATPVISNLVFSEFPWVRMVVTIQLELAQRIVARPRTSDYSALSVWLQSQCQVELLRKLAPSVFWPRPKVNSAIVLLTPDEPKRALIEDRVWFHDFVRQVFTQRRKLLRGVLAGRFRQHLSKADVDACMEGLGLGPTTRAEELEVATFVELANRIGQLVRQQEHTARE